MNLVREVRSLESRTEIAELLVLFLKNVESLKSLYSESCAFKDMPKHIKRPSTLSTSNLSVRTHSLTSCHWPETSLSPLPLKDTLPALLALDEDADDLRIYIAYGCRSSHTSCTSMHAKLKSVEGNQIRRLTPGVSYHAINHLSDLYGYIELMQRSGLLFEYIMATHFNGNVPLFMVIPKHSISLRATPHKADNLDEEGEEDGCFNVEEQNDAVLS
jgi:hypothetical protein